MVDESRSLMEIMRKRQKNWIEHVLRHDSLLQKVIEWRFQGKKTPGRPRTMLLDALLQEDEDSVIDFAKLKEKAHDRETWRQWKRTCLWAENTNNNRIHKNTPFQVKKFWGGGTVRLRPHTFKLLPVRLTMLRVTAGKYRRSRCGRLCWHRLRPSSRRDLHATTQYQGRSSSCVAPVWRCSRRRCDQIPNNVIVRLLWGSTSFTVEGRKKEKYTTHTYT